MQVVMPSGGKLLLEMLLSFIKKKQYLRNLKRIPIFQSTFIQE